MSMFQTEVQEDGREGEGGERLQKVRREMGGRGRIRARIDRQKGRKE